ncbi:FeoA family protein [Ectobacillus polymachus]|uniref:FeoA family protein n=1 Tax=Ectobacillus polymachus TaxID=1508806 RepID=UPI003A89150E
MLLSNIEIGNRAIIDDLSNLNSTIQRRLVDMGINEGVSISLKRKLPFGGPFIIEVFGQSISLRRLEASRIQVSLGEV